MAKKLTPKLILFKKDLKCGSCNQPFPASDSQVYHAYYEKTPVYCSPECKREGMGAKVSAARAAVNVECGPCPTCQKTFLSKDPDRIYCTHECWIKSPKFLEHLKAAGKLGNAVVKEKAEAARPICPVCEKNKVKAGNKYCSTRCYRQYLVDLFDKWVANPERVGEVSNFDEWLLQEELPCLIEGCGWKGKHLGNHVYMVHGVRAKEFKRLVGFNLSTGLVVRSTKGQLSDRPQVGKLSLEEFFARVKSHNPGQGSKYVSKENLEHRIKARALKLADPAKFVTRRKAKRKTNVPTES